MILQKLLQAGLNKREAIIYMALLELGKATIADIVKKTQIKRSTIYDMLELLKGRGLVSRSLHKKRQIFYAEDPIKIIENLERKKRGMQEAMPELVSMMNILDKKPKMRYFEGASGVQEIFDDTLRYSNNKISTWIPFPYLNLDKTYFWKHYNTERIKKKIWMRAIMPLNEKNKKFSEKLKEYLVITKLLNDEAFSSLDIEIKIYGKAKVGIISYSEDLGIIIESKKIFNGFQAIFEGMWNGINN